MIIRRYFYNEVWRTFFSILAILILIYMGHRFVRYLNDAASGNLAESAIFSLLLLKTLSSQVVLIPLSAFLATLITFGRMHQDNEITALISTGVSPQRLLLKVGIFSSILAVLAGVISWQLAPQAEEQSYRIQDKIRADVRSQNIAPAQFNTFNHDRSIIYAESAKNKGRLLQQVFIQRQKTDGDIDIIYAQTAHREVNPETGEEYFILNNGVRYELNHYSQAGRRTEFAQSGILMQSLEVEESWRKRWAQPTQRLIAADTAKDMAEVQWRISAIISTFLLPLLAYFLSKTDSRSGRYAKIMTGILIYLLYNNLLAASKAWVENGTLSPMIGLWWVHAVVVALLVFLAHRQGLFHPGYSIPEHS